ncbi:MAG: hypothetical protein PHS31_05095 [Victivallaceae bacterium]|nr:hypothetical protein [Victivallaceae bacterium]
MNDDKLYRFDYYLSPACPFHINFMQYEQASETPTVLDIHKAIHFGIITSGTITSRICDTTLKIDEKGCYLIAPWEPHGTLRRSAGLGIILIGWLIVSTYPYMLYSSLIPGACLLTACCIRR